MAQDLQKKILMGIILVIIFAVVMFLFIGKTSDSIWDINQKEMCKKSVQMQAAKKQSLTFMGTHLSDRYGNKVELQCSTEYKKIKTKNEEVIKRTIANSMVDCWDQYGKGEYELFDTVDQNFCVVCSSLEFTKVDKVKDFNKFIMKKNINSISSETYFEYFNNIKVKDNQVLELEENQELKEKDLINLENPLAIMFVMDKNAYPDAWFDQVQVGKYTGVTRGTTAGLVVGAATGIILCGTGVGCIVGAAILGTVLFGATGYTIGSSSASEHDARIVLWDYNDIKNLNCTQLEGRSTPIQPIRINNYK